MDNTDNITDTIAAMATAPPQGRNDGAIGIIRVSGPGAFGVARRVFRGKKPFDSIQPYTIAYGSIFDGDSPLDEALLLKMRSPRSYTREDVVEFHCHAGAEVQRRILRAVLRAGARAAAPGEFTKRAFLNGRIDLAQAEAVMDMIRANSEAGASAAMRQLTGGLSAKLQAARESLINLVASLEAYLDFPEHEVGERDIVETAGRVDAVRTELSALAESFTYGKAAREGVTCVIAGRPNVGKSTLLNLLAGRERAIVTDIPGTTRDVIDEYRNLCGFTVRFLDTAGIRDTSDPVERLGVERTVDAIGKADLALLVFDAADGVEGVAAEGGRLFALAAGKRTVALVNKTDLVAPSVVAAVTDAVTAAVTASVTAAVVGGRLEVIEASLLNGEALPRIEDAIGRLFRGQAVADMGDAVLTSERHYALVLRALASVRGAWDALMAGLPFEMPVVDLRDALAALGEITGETCDEEIIDRVFSEFCIGK